MDGPLSVEFWERRACCRTRCRYENMTPSDFTSRYIAWFRSTASACAPAKAFATHAIYETCSKRCYTIAPILSPGRRASVNGRRIHLHFPVRQEALICLPSATERRYGPASRTRCHEQLVQLHCFLRSLSWPLKFAHRCL